MIHPHQNTVQAVNKLTDGPKPGFKSAYVEIDTSGVPIQATSSKDAIPKLRSWINTLNPSQGWIQYFSFLDYFISGHRELDLKTDDTPLIAEFFCKDGRYATLRHIGGYEWGYSIYKISEEKSDSNKPIILEPNIILANKGVMIRISDQSEDSVPNKLNYQWLWDHDPDSGAINRVINLFSGFDMGETK